MFKKTAAPASTGYTIAKSLRFRASASATITRTPAVASNRRTWTWSAWVKRGVIGTSGGIFEATNAGKGAFLTWGNNTLAIQLYDPTYNTVWETPSYFRDPASWYHIVLAVDTTQASQSNMVKFYVNGVQQTTTITNYAATLPQNYQTYVNDTVKHNFNTYVDGTYGYADQYIAEVNFIDGQALTPSSFASNSGTGGVWQPIKYTGTYGTNGFYLKFTDTTSTTTLCYDYSGNSNNWTPNNISLTSGVTYDSMTDVPTLTSATVSNYATLNPILQDSWWAAPARGTITWGNLRLSAINGTGFSNFDFRTPGKWYVEITITTNSQSGSQIIFATQSRTSFEVDYTNNGNKVINASTSSYGSSWTTGDVIGVAIDPANNQITYYKNNVSQGTITNTYPSTPVYLGYYSEVAATDTIDFNFGQRPFVYTPPTGYVAVNTYNLSTPTIAAGNQYMDATTFTANGGTQTITNAGSFKPDFIWQKNRSIAQNHYLVDSNRGSSLVLRSNTSGVETTDANFVTSINTNGWTMGSSNFGNGESIVGWQWQAGQGTTSSNTNGSVTSNVSVSTTAAFSIATFTTPGSSGYFTVGHGLGTTPAMVIMKPRNASGDSWVVYHQNMGSPAYNYFALLNTTGAATNSTTIFGAAPTSTTFQFNAGLAMSLSSTCVMYSWAQVAGFSQFGSYTGNGSTDGVFIYFGFRPKFVMIKRIDGTPLDSWYFVDTSRSTYNVTEKWLTANSSDAEGSGVNFFDVLSNGIKLRGSGGYENTSGANYIYAAFAENPFKYALAR